MYIDGCILLFLSNEVHQTAYFGTISYEIMNGGYIASSSFLSRRLQLKPECEYFSGVGRFAYTYQIRRPLLPLMAVGGQMSLCWNPTHRSRSALKYGVDS